MDPTLARALLQGTHAGATRAVLQELSIAFEVRSGLILSDEQIARLEQAIATLGSQRRPGLTDQDEGVFLRAVVEILELGYAGHQISLALPAGVSPMSLRALEEPRRAPARPRPAARTPKTR